MSDDQTCGATTFVDRSDLMETFADSVHGVTYDGDTLRLLLGVNVQMSVILVPMRHDDGLVLAVKSLAVRQVWGSFEHEDLCHEPRRRGALARHASARDRNTAASRLTMPSGFRARRWTAQDGVPDALLRQWHVDVVDAARRAIILNHCFCMFIMTVLSCNAP